MSQHIS